MAGEIIFGNINCLHFIQIPSKQLRKTQEPRYHNSTFIFTADIMFGSLCQMRIFSRQNVKKQIEETPSAGINDILNGQGFAMHHRAIFRCVRVVLAMQKDWMLYSFLFNKLTSYCKNNNGCKMESAVLKIYH